MRRSAFSNFCKLRCWRVMLAGCAVGPNYKRPAVDTPQTFRGAPAETPSAASFGDEKWSEVFQDPQLQALIRTALQQNYDVRIAATRILQAQAQLSITRGNEFPSAAAVADEQRQPERRSRSSFGPTTPAIPNSGSDFSGIWTSGVSTVAPRKPRAINCWPAIGRGKR